MKTRFELFFAPPSSASATHLSSTVRPRPPLGYALIGPTGRFGVTGDKARSLAVLEGAAQQFDPAKPPWTVLPSLIREPWARSNRPPTRSKAPQAKSVALNPLSVCPKLTV